MLCWSVGELGWQEKLEAGTSLRLAFSCPASLRKFLILSSGTDLQSDSTDLGEELGLAAVGSHSNYQGLGISCRAGPGLQEVQKGGHGPWEPGNPPSIHLFPCESILPGCVYRLHDSLWGRFRGRSLTPAFLSSTYWFQGRFWALGSVRRYSGVDWEKPASPKENLSSVFYNLQLNPWMTEYSIGHTK